MRLTDEEQYAKIYLRDEGRCQTCGKFLQYGHGERAHRIKKGKYSEDNVILFFKYKWERDLTRKQAQDILNHPLNLRLTCPGACNDAQNIFYKPIERNNLLITIKEVMYD